MYQHAAKAPSVSLDTLEEFYSATKEACDEAKNEVCAVLPVAKNGPDDQRLSTKSSTKLAKLLLDRKEYSRLQPVSLRILDVLSFRSSPHCMRLVHLAQRLAHPKIRRRDRCVSELPQTTGEELKLQCWNYMRWRFRCTVILARTENSR